MKTNPIDKLESFKYGELGHLGLKVQLGTSQEELNRDLNFPQSISTFKCMLQNSTVNSSINFYNAFLSKATWSFKAPSDASKKELKQTAILNSMLGDMDGQTWQEFILDAATCASYGFALNEIVLRKRNKKFGSKYDDGIVAWRKLPLRAQETITKAIWDDTGNNLAGFKQNVSNIKSIFVDRYANRVSSEVNIPIKKLLHFRFGTHRGNPFGQSLLRNAYLCWKSLELIEELEATGVQKDLTGIPVMYLPLDLLAADADPQKIAVREYYQNAIRNLHNNEQSGVILPSVFDNETKKPLFSLELLSQDGKKNFDTGEIKQYYKNAIYTALATDVLVMGQTTVGSFALGAIKQSLAGTVAFSLANTIKETIQNQLVRLIYEENDWDVSRMATIDVDGLLELDSESLSKLIQRTASVGALEIDRDVLNVIRTAVGADALASDLEPQDQYLPKMTSRAGDGQEPGKTPGNGTGDGVAFSDNASLNLDNAA